MGTTLTGTTPQDTYDSLIKVTDNGPLSATAKYLSDGLGNDSTLALSTGYIGMGTTSLNSRLTIQGGDGLTVRNAGDTFVQLIDTTDAGTNYIEFKDNGGASGGILYNHSTNYMSFKTNSTESMRITSAGNVGIGTSLPTALLTVAGTSDLAWSASTSKLQVSRSATVARFQNYENGSASSIALQWDGGNVGIGTDSPAALIHGSQSAGNAPELRLSSATVYAKLIADDAVSGTAILDGAYAIKLLVDGSERARVTPNGLTFNGDTAAANALDDYEEGTWTPTYSSAGATFTYLGQGGAYTKIGRQVWAQFYLRVTATGTLTNTVIIDGLPFTSLNSALVQNSASVWYTGTKNITPLNGVNSVFINLWVNNVSPPSLLLASDVAGGEYMVGTLTYFV